VKTRHSGADVNVLHFTCL